MYLKDKSLNIHVRLTPAQILYLRQMSDVRGKSISGYLRDIINLDMRLHNFVGVDDGQIKKSN